MRELVAAIFVVLLAACNQSEPQAQAGCARAVTREVAWSGAQPDRIVASSEGSSCAQAFVTLSIRNAAGDALWVFSSTYHDMVAGGPPPSDAAPVSVEQMDPFLSGWANVTLNRTGAMPEWRADAATLTESATTFAYFTPLERDVYESLRERDLPMLCYAVGAESTQCLIIDPPTGAPAPFVAYGP